MFKRHTPWPSASCASDFCCLVDLCPPLRAQSLDELLACGTLPDDARAAPGELTLGPTLPMRWKKPAPKP